MVSYRDRTPIELSPLKALLLAATVACVLLLLGPALSAQAQSNGGSSVTPQVVGAFITVETTDEASTNDGKCSLREAITNANDNAQTSPDCAPGSATAQDTIVFAKGVSGPITLTSALPLITDPMGLTIDGGDAAITIDGNNAVQPLQTSFGSKLTLQKLTVANGNGTFGGGIDNNGTMTVTDSTFSKNQGNGGGIFNNNILTVTNSTFSGNTTDQFGRGGGIHNNGGAQLTVTDSTFSGNSASTAFGPFGGGISLFNPATIKNTILTNNTGGNCAEFTPGLLDDGGYNISDDGSCAFTQATSKSNTDPLLDPNGLQDNGGPTKTIALQPTSPAIDQGNSFGSTTDQRGKPRPMDFPSVQNAPGGDGSDIGAFELQQLSAPPPGGGGGGGGGTPSPPGTNPPPPGTGGHHKHGGHHHKHGGHHHKHGGGGVNQ